MEIMDIFPEGQNSEDNQFYQYLQDTERNWMAFLQHKDQEIQRLKSIYSKKEHLKAAPVTTDEAALTSDIIESDQYFILLQGITQFIEELWDPLLLLSPAILRPICVHFFKGLHLLEKEATLGLIALGMDQGNLALCHFKRGLAIINKGFEQINFLTKIARCPSFLKEVSRGLFDLRDLLLYLGTEARATHLQDNDYDE